MFYEVLPSALLLAPYRLSTLRLKLQLSNVLVPPCKKAACQPPVKVHPVAVSVAGILNMNGVSVVVKVELVNLTVLSPQILCRDGHQSLFPADCHKYGVTTGPFGTARRLLLPISLHQISSLLRIFHMLYSLQQQWWYFLRINITFFHLRHSESPYVLT